MSNKTRLQTNNTNLQALIDKANALPDAGSGGGSGGAHTIPIAVAGTTVYGFDADGKAFSISEGMAEFLGGIAYVPNHLTCTYGSSAGYVRNQALVKFFSVGHISPQGGSGS